MSLPSDVFVLWHYRDCDDGRRDKRLVGVYSTPENAEAARDRAALVPEFQGAGRRFEIDSYIVDLDYWQGSLDHLLPPRAVDGPTLRSCRGKESLEELLAGITPENRHPEVDWGPPVGREVLPPYEGDCR